MLSTYTVITTDDNANNADPTPGSLRWAIVQNNADVGNPSTDRIEFNIPGSDVHVINLLNDLPPITHPVFIDGYSQPGSLPNTNPVTQGDNAVPLVQLDGSLDSFEPCGGCDIGLNFAPGSANSTVRGLIVTGFAAIGIAAGTNTAVEGNFIGTDPTGTRARGNGSGVGVYGGGGHVGTNGDGVNDDAERNLISGNLGNGIRADGVGNVVAGNFIGTDATGTVPLGNGAYGVQPNSDFSVRVGADGHDADPVGERNVISGNGYGGVLITGSNAVVAGNFIGTDVSGTHLLSNGLGAPGYGVGIQVYLGDRNRIGTDGDGVGDAFERNIIAGDPSRVDGIYLGGGSTRTLVAGNFIGTDVSGTQRLGNRTGVLFDGSSGNRIGADGQDANPTAERNVISGNLDGITVDSGAHDNVVAGNFIGTDINGSQPLGNQYDGILISGDHNRIGTDSDGVGDATERNVITFNARGVVVASGAGISILGNSIHDNGGLGIDLGADGATPNDSHPGQPGPNGWQNSPVLTHACAGSSSTVIGTFHSTPNDTFRIEFFASPMGDPSGYGQGQRFLGYVNITTDANGDMLAGAPGVGAATVNVTTDAQGHPQFQVIGLGASAVGEAITATATALTGPNVGSTSEFSAWFTADSAGSISGVVFSDFNDDGQVDFGEQGIPGVPINLDGTDSAGNSVHLSQNTDADGTYVFQILAPGTYTVTEAQQPGGYTQGTNTIGTAGGTVSGDQFIINLAACQDAMNYNYGERPAATGPIQQGQTAGIGFWNNKNGQALIKALNGGVGTQLGDWLAATFPHMFGSLAGANNLAGKSNASIAALFQSDFVVHGQKLDAQVLATALAVYVTDATLDNTGVGTQYGFLVVGNGVATATVNVGSSGAAFGVANSTVMTVLDILLAADAQAVNGVLYNGNATRRNQANTVFSAVNEAGGL